MPIFQIIFQNLLYFLEIFWKNLLKTFVLNIIRKGNIKVMFSFFFPKTFIKMKLIIQKIAEIMKRGFCKKEIIPILKLNYGNLKTF